MPRVLVAVADGSEDIETVAVVDVLRRAEIDVTLASVMPGERVQVTTARRIVLVADTHISTVAEQSFDLIVLPGGMPGAEHLASSGLLTDMLRHQHEEGRFIAAICAAPAVVLARSGMLRGVRATCYPGFFSQMAGAQVERDLPVVIDRGFITSQGVGTTLLFSLELVRKLTDGARAQTVANAMLVPYTPLP